MTPLFEERLMVELFSSTNNPSYGLPTLLEQETDWLTEELQARIVSDAEQKSLSLGIIQSREEELV
ncbi:hypothetical protein D3D03_11845 [Exiguobacterium sp. RIT452]|jgi:hypothetical protein|uniref:Uncharacterized protein n=1 Tax=Exiguobacterium undae TaxID=169177 RepID=A0ABX2V6H5_9BACL|nr:MULTISPECIES: hypothetical protein [Exiguobacterium]OAN12221.1 hypothetical protein A3783_11785 [Exiguobacterium undae]RJO97460.1 hypothetical protein D3D03_11845 [Exiguobacterium sp. RIT452]